MKRILCVCLSAVYIFGVVFPGVCIGEGGSLFIQEIKKIFHYSAPETATEKAKAKKGPIVREDEGTGLYQGIRNLFHYFPEETKRAKPKEYPLTFDKALEKELRYPQKEVK